VQQPPRHPTDDDPAAATKTTSASTTTTTNRQRRSPSDKANAVFPSILPILQAHALAQQVEYWQQEEEQQQLLQTHRAIASDDPAAAHSALHIFPAGDQGDVAAALRRLARTKSRAFRLVDLRTPIHRLVQWEQSSATLGNVRFLYRLAGAHADPLFLRVLQRLPRTGLVVQSTWDLECGRGVVQRARGQEGSAADDEQTEKDGSPATPCDYYDDTRRAGRPDSYLRQAVLDYGMRTLTVDGPREVARICAALARLTARRAAASMGSSTSSSNNTNASPLPPTPPLALQFMLRLPTRTSRWPALLAAALEEIQRQPGCQLAGLSVDLAADKDEDDPQPALEAFVESLPSSPDRTSGDEWQLRIDLTGVTDFAAMAPWWQRLQSHARIGQVTVDATDALMATSGALCTRIIGVKTLGERRHYYIDDGCYGSLSKAGAGAPLPLLRSSLEESRPEDDNEGNPTPTVAPPTFTSTVWGPTCDGLDRVCPTVDLPALERDDWLVFPQSHISSGEGQGTAFNGFDPPDTVYCVLGYFK
jgi:hypothetical protein